jgi:hypothetical protein
VLELRQGDPPTGPEELPTSNIFFYCDDLPQTDEELRARSVDFPQPPVEQSFGWWSMFQRNRFALSPREGPVVNEQNRERARGARTLAPTRQ